MVHSAVTREILARLLLEMDSRSSARQEFFREMITKQDVPTTFTCSWTEIVMNDERSSNEIESNAANTTALHKNLRKSKVSWY